MQMAPEASTNQPQPIIETAYVPIPPYQAQTQAQSQPEVAYPTQAQVFIPSSGMAKKSF